MQKLVELKTKEISLVPQGANRRRFMVFKSADMTDLQNKIAKADPKMLDAIANIVKADGAGRTALQAVGRILSAVKDKVSPAEAHATLDEVGFKMGEGELGGAGANTVGEAPSHSETITMGMPKKEDLEKARSAATKAYEEEMAKLGHAMYPEESVQMKSKGGKPMEKKKENDEEDDEVEKSAKLDPETQAKLETIFKANEDLVKKNSELRSEISALQQVNDHRDLVQKAAAFSDLGLPTEMIVANLADAKKAGQESFDRVIKQYEMLTERQKVSKSFGGNLFGEIGSSLPGGSHGSESSWDRIQKAADGYVQKSAFVGTKEQAIAKFLETPEGIRLYSEHQAGRKDNI